MSEIKERVFACEDFKNINEKPSSEKRASNQGPQKSVVLDIKSLAIKKFVVDQALRHVQSAPRKKCFHFQSTDESTDEARRSVAQLRQAVHQLEKHLQTKESLASLEAEAYSKLLRQASVLSELTSSLTPLSSAQFSSEIKTISNLSGDAWALQVLVEKSTLTNNPE